MGAGQMEETDDGPDHELAMWRMEIGEVGSPGACFHVQILGQKNQPPFPDYLPIPRIPTMMFTPMLAFDYVLGELFQDDWPRHVLRARNRGDVSVWRGIQTKRLKNVLSWQLETLDSGGTTPWTWMNKLELPPDLFTRPEITHVPGRRRPG